MSLLTPMIIAALALLAAAPASATVEYSFTIFTNSFVYDSPDFITTDRNVPAAALKSCQYSGSSANCRSIDFLVAKSGFGDSIFFNGFDGGFGTGFAAHVFQNPGTYSGDRPSASLTVSTVPEPDAWTLLIAGFALTGTAVRRRRRAFA